MRQTFLVDETLSLMNKMTIVNTRLSTMEANDATS